jgi:hypothetical protein
MKAFIAPSGLNGGYAQFFPREVVNFARIFRGISRKISPRIAWLPL